MLHLICGCVRVFMDILVCADADMCIRETMGQPRVSLLRCHPTVVCALDTICRWRGTRQVG